MNPVRTVDRAARKVLFRLGLSHPLVRVAERRSVTAPAYAARTGARYVAVRPAETPVHVPVQHGDRHAEFEELLVPIPELGVIWLSKAIVVGSMGRVLTKEREFLSTSAFSTRRPGGRRSEGRLHRVRGTLATIASENAAGNYGHFLMDSLPRVALLEDAGVRWDDVDHVFCSWPTNSAARLLDQLGVPTDRRIRATLDIAVRADTTIATSYPGSRRNYPRWMVTFLRDRLGVPAGPPSRRLYIPRTKHRRIVNADELWAILEAHGFEVFEPTGGEDPRKAFAEAEVVVGGHGAGLADLVFCRPGTRVLELVPDSHVRPFYMTLSTSAELRYGYLVGEGIPADGVITLRWDYRVDVDQFRRALEATLA